MTANPAIPGLGSAKPGEVFPASNFAPDTIAAAANMDGCSGEETMVADNSSDRADFKQPEPTKESGKGAEDEVEAMMQQMGQQQYPRSSSTDLDMADISEGIQEQSSSAMAGSTQATDQSAPAPPTSPDVTHALEAALDGLLERARTPAEHENLNTVGEQDEAEGVRTAPEWEADSSPYQSEFESETCSDTSSSDDSDDEEVSLLTVEETARMLMEADAGSDDEGDGVAGKGTRASAQVRTKHEQAEEPDQKPDITITAEEEVALLGSVAHIVEGTQVVINAQTDTQNSVVLDSGSILCKEDRTVVGVVHDTIATVHRPVYLMLFSSVDDVAAAGIVKDLQIWYPTQHAKYVFPGQLRQQKGSDASNLHDEEVGPEEMEFSDDEQEQAHKREKRDRKAKRRGARGRALGEQHVGHPLRQEVIRRDGNSEVGLDYDDDGPYRPLARPAIFGQGLPPPPSPATYSVHQGNTRGGSYRGRRGEFRGRGGRGGQSYGGRGQAGAAGYGTDISTGYSLPPRSGHQPLPPSFPDGSGSLAISGQWIAPPGIPAPPFGTAPPPAGTANFNFQMPGWNPPFPFAPPPPPPPQQNWSGQAQHGAGGFGYPPHYDGAQGQGQNGQQQWR
ncbi:H/ACA ribonucleoprotein complex non-core subunit NAF1 [Pleurostoma richardsiae]|uniref:H/ACA ribonucleoprotein complex non-core subunit NAF1 n=1 Tax=Pleurostoma richardsiae TaxID=41990 RepID=A0AA38VKF4_9PEZI|nr:H/ACA ribonucleoprotein complex non-core subunit NAF1 [Pleurostoma richardsiae]